MNDIVQIKRWESIRSFVLWKRNELFTITKGEVLYSEDHELDLLKTLWYNGFLRPDGVDV